jgi:hypothetical protein
VLDADEFCQVLQQIVGYFQMGTRNKRKYRRKILFSGLISFQMHSNLGILATFWMKLVLGPV